MKYQTILIVTYGRSGSTLLQGVVNTLPNVLIRGENHNFCWGLYQSWKSLVETKARFASKAKDPTTAWYGAQYVDPDNFLLQAREALRLQLSIPSEEPAICWGFKEIRYIENLDALPQFLEFLSKLLPNVAILFNTRSHDAVCGSAFWRRHDQSKLRQVLKRADRLFLEYAEEHKNAYVVRYEALVRGGSYISSLFDFLGASVDYRAIEDVLRTPHSFLPKPDTLTAADQVRSKASAFLSQTCSLDFPCRLDKEQHACPSDDGVIVFAVVKNELSRLPWWFTHYRGLGCRKFIVVDNGSTDGTVRYLREQLDVILYHSPSHLFSTSRAGRDWLNILSRMHAMGKWAIVADADELLTWPNSVAEGIRALTERATRMGLNRVFTPLIDLYSARPCRDLPPYEPGEPFSRWCSWADPIHRAKAFWSKERLILYSGPRMRFTTDMTRPPIMSKQSLYYVESNGLQQTGAHFDNYGTPSPLVVPLLHYKFLPDFDKRIDAAIADGQHWNNAADYRSYKKLSLSEKVLLLDDSIRVRDGNDLRQYISTLSETIRSAGLSGSLHLKSFFQLSGDGPHSHTSSKDTA